MSAETVIDPENDYLAFVDASETPDGLNKLLMKYVREVRIPFRIGDSGADLTTGTKLTLRTPFAITVTEVRGSVSVAPVGSTIIFDVNDGGVSIFSTRPTIDAGEETTATAAVPAVISDATLAADAEITIDIDQVGSGTAGRELTGWIIGYRA